MKLTKNNIEQMPIPATSYKIYRDERLTGFCLRVRNTGTKTFIIDRKVNGKLHRCNIGQFGELTPEQARTQAQKILGQLVIGVDPKTNKSKHEENAVTLIEVFNDYLAARKSLKPKTIKGYEMFMKGKFADWYHLPISSITKEMITKRHATIGKTSPVTANNAMKLIGALFNFAMYEYDTASNNFSNLQNPVLKLSKTRAWYPCKRRRTKIETHQLPAWFRAVNQLRDSSAKSIGDTVRDYLIVLLFTGLRREEAAQRFCRKFYDGLRNVKHELSVDAIRLLMRKIAERPIDFLKSYVVFSSTCDAAQFP